MSGFEVFLIFVIPAALFVTQTVALLLLLVRVSSIERHIDTASTRARIDAAAKELHSRGQDEA